MNYSEISEQWSVDGNIDRSRLDLESLKIPQLHNKYWKMFSRERINLKKTENSLAVLKLLKTEYYLGALDQETLQDNGWEQVDRKILKTDIPHYLDSDTEMVEMKMRVNRAFEKADFLQSILKEISNMQWNIKNAIAFMQFQAGS